MQKINLLLSLGQKSVDPVILEGGLFSQTQSHKGQEET